MNSSCSTQQTLNCSPRWSCKFRWSGDKGLRGTFCAESADLSTCHFGYSRCDNDHTYFQRWMKGF